MSAPDARSPGPRDPRDARRERVIGLLVLGIALVLLVSSVSWFAGGQTGWGAAQVVLAVALAAAGGFLTRRARRQAL